MIVKLTQLSYCPYKMDNNNNIYVLLIRDVKENVLLIKFIANGTRENIEREIGG